MQSKKQKSLAFSIFELVVVIAVIGFLAGVSFKLIPSLMPAKTAIISKTVITLNKAVMLYVGNGGNLSGITDPRDVIDKLQTITSEDDKLNLKGLTGNYLKSDLEPQFQTLKEAKTNNPRILWDSNEKKFFISKNEDSSNIPGIVRFIVIEDSNVIEEKRGYVASDGSTQDSSLKSGEDQNWIWKYDDKATSIKRLRVQNIPNETLTANQAPKTEDLSDLIKILDPPEIVIDGGEKPFTFYQTSKIIINNPNPGNIPSKIKFRFNWNYINWAKDWNDYPDDGVEIISFPSWSKLYVQAYIESLAPLMYRNSPVSDIGYHHIPILLGKPTIDSPDEIDGNEGSKEITLKLIPNSSDNEKYPGSLAYRILYDPDTENPTFTKKDLVKENLDLGEEIITTGILSKLVSDFDSPFIIEARAISISNAFDSSEPSSKTIKYKLISPIINTNKTAISSIDEKSTVTITNNNNSNNTEIYYTIITKTNCDECNKETLYTAPFQVGYEHVKSGDVTIKACSVPKKDVPLEEHYIDTCKTHEQKITRSNMVCTQLIEAGKRAQVQAAPYKDLRQKLIIYKEINGNSVKIQEKIFDPKNMINNCEDYKDNCFILFFYPPFHTNCTIDQCIKSSFPCTFPNCEYKYRYITPRQNVPAKFCFETLYDINNNGQWEGGLEKHVWTNSSSHLRASLGNEQNDHLVVNVDIPNTCRNGCQVRIKNGGAYIARFHVTYLDDNWNLHSRVDSDIWNPASRTYRIPKHGKVIRVRGESDTGVVGDRWRTWLDQRNEDGNNCYKMLGTTFHGGWSRHCH